MGEGGRESPSEELPLSSERSFRSELTFRGLVGEVLCVGDELIVEAGVGLRLRVICRVARRVGGSGRRGAWTLIGWPSGCWCRRAVLLGSHWLEPQRGPGVLWEG